IGSRLVPLMVERAREYVRERGEDLRAVITATAPSDNTDLAAILETQGLLPARWSFLMFAELPDVAGTEVTLPEGYVVETWEGLDHDELRLAHNAAFVGHPGWTPWSPQMWYQH